MPARDLIGAEFRVLASSSQIIAAPATTPFDFGSPDDVYLPNLTNWNQGDRLVLVLTAVRAAGTTSTLAFTIQDADDNAGAIGTPATAVTDGTSLVAAKGNQTKIVGVKLQNGRPWLRVNALHTTGGTDSYSCTALLLGI